MDGTPVLRTAHSEDGGQATDLIYADSKYLYCASDTENEVLVRDYYASNEGDGTASGGRALGKVLVFDPPFIKMSHASSTIYALGGVNSMEEVTDSSIAWFPSGDKKAFVRTWNGTPVKVRLAETGEEVTPPAGWEGTLHVLEARDSHYVLFEDDTNSVLMKSDGTTLIPAGTYDSITCIAGIDAASVLAAQKDGQLLIIDLNSSEGKAYDSYVVGAEQPSSWAQAEVDAAVSAELVAPDYQNGYVSPCSRETFCELIARMLTQRTGKSLPTLAEESGGEQIQFNDTTNSNVLACAQLGIINGMGDGRFAPNDSITREQAATMLARAAAVLGIESNCETVDFADEADISSFAKDAVTMVSAMENAEGKRVMQGVGNASFEPKGTYTREQSILTVYRLFRMDG